MGLFDLLRYLPYLGFLGTVAALFARARTLYPGRPVRTLILIEDPGTPITIGAVEAKLAGTGLTVLPGFSITP